METVKEETAPAWWKETELVLGHVVTGAANRSLQAREYKMARLVVQWRDSTHDRLTYDPFFQASPSHTQLFQNVVVQITNFRDMLNFLFSR